ncbi:guanine nucleotide exchange C9orf72-like [Pecten maximus]|uniref:guanine nucleotide exchange C9orf72-like n=1 Tax=Pecten maximus TaxID=6579 RepID=UPI00145807BB|nr:guanine nucleotide exchange C9orf72-like [Pecten maximus]XP_033736621.1 guanine nucleotide exchange C9orf72-like [Pecten maximus]
MMSSSRNIKQITRHVDAGVIHLTSETNFSSNQMEIESPLSPSSTYVKAKLDEEISPDFISAFIFAHWDNILGPRILNVWQGTECHLTERMLNQVCSRSLSGEMCRDIQDSFVDFKFLDLAEMDMILAGFVFIARGSSGLSVHSMSVLMPHSELPTYLEMHDLLSRCLNGIINKLRRFLHMSDTPHPDINGEFVDRSRDCLKMLTSIYKSSLAIPINLSETFLSPTHLLERDFLCRCIAAHLLTFGHSLVIGENTNRINLLITTLALFNTKKERRCSMKIRDGCTCHHDLFVQGIVKKCSDAYDLPVAQIVDSKYPVSIINLTTRDVKQAYSYHHQRFYSPQGVGPNNELTLIPVEHSENLVLALMDELEKLPAECGVREAYIAHFVTTLQRKALALIKYVEGETNFGSTMFRSGMKKLRQDLGIASEGDLQIILATAEKLKPGILYFVFGDGQWSSRSTDVWSSGVLE